MRNSRRNRQKMRTCGENGWEGSCFAISIQVLWAQRGLARWGGISNREGAVEAGFCQDGCTHLNHVEWYILEQGEVEKVKLKEKTNTPLSAYPWPPSLNDSINIRGPNHLNYLPILHQLSLSQLMGAWDNYKDLISFLIPALLNI